MKVCFAYPLTHTRATIFICIPTALILLLISCSKSIETLSEQLNNKDEDAKLVALNSLTQINDRRVCDLLLYAFADESDLVSRHAFQAFTHYSISGAFSTGAPEYTKAISKNDLFNRIRQRQMLLIERLNRIIHSDNSDMRRNGFRILDYILYYVSDYAAWDTILINALQDKNLRDDTKTLLFEKWKTPLFGNLGEPIDNIHEVLTDTRKLIENERFAYYPIHKWEGHNDVRIPFILNQRILVSDEDGESDLEWCKPVRNKEFTLAVIINKRFTFQGYYRRDFSPSSPITGRAYSATADIVFVNWPERKIIGRIVSFYVGTDYIGHLGDNYGDVKSSILEWFSRNCIFLSGEFAIRLRNNRSVDLQSIADQLSPGQ